MGSVALKNQDADWPFIARLAIGFIQGCALYWVAELRLYEPQFGFEPDTWRNFVTMLRTLCVFAPLPLIFGVGNLPLPRLSAWTAAASAVLAVVGWLAPAPVWSGAPPVVTVWLFSLISIYIVHEFLQAAYNDQRAIARYETYFDMSWRHGFQAVLAIIFIAAFWAVISLGAWLFYIIGIHWVFDTIFSPEFAWIATAMAFALGIHWTDAASDLTRGVRQIGLALLSWLAILMTVILAAFLASLLFTGLEPLWDTNNATLLLLNAAAVMILLINAAFQSGTPPENALIRTIVRFSAFPLLGVVCLAALGLWLRVDQYGLTPARVLAGAQLLVVSVYAFGYVAAAVKPGPWMDWVKPVNIAGAAFVAAMLVALMTPIADPARLSVANQMARLDSGRVDPDDFDFGFLGSDRSRHWGQTALATLKSRRETDRDKRIAELAERLGDDSNYDRGRHSFNERRDAVRMIGGGDIPEAALLPVGRPDPIGDCLQQKRSFDEQVRYGIERRRELDGKPEASLVDVPSEWNDGLCLGRLIDLDQDGDDDLLLWSNRNHWDAFNNILYYALIQRGPDDWVPFATFKQNRVAKYLNPNEIPAETKKKHLDTLEAEFAKAKVVAPDRLDLLFTDRRLRLQRPNRAWQSPVQMRQRINMLDNRQPPPELLQDYPQTNLLSDCTPNTDATIDSTIACYGRHIDVTGDGTDEFLIIRLASDIRHIVAQSYRQTDDGWEQLGQGEDWHPDALKLDQIEDDLEKKQRIKAARTELLNSLETAEPLLWDIELSGTRMMLSYQMPNIPRQRRRR